MSGDVIHIDTTDSHNIAFYQIDVIFSEKQDRFVEIFIFTDSDGTDIKFNTNAMTRLTDPSLVTAFSRETIINIIEKIIGNAAWCINKLLDPACIITHPDDIFIHDTVDHISQGNVLMKYLPVRDTQTIHHHAYLCDELIDFFTLYTEENEPTSCEFDLLKGMDLYKPDECLTILKRMRESKTDMPESGRAKSSKLNINPSVSICILIASQLFIVTASVYLLINLYLFSSPAPVMTFVILMLVLLFGADIYVASDRSSPFRKLIIESSDKRKKYRDNHQTNSYSEKTVLLEAVKEKSRIAMLCSGLPGTAEEGSAHKGFILSDDFLIGRDGSKVDFKIDVSSVGRSHARIMRRQNTFFIEDLGSHNGTFIDGKRLKKGQEYILPDNCCISFADKEYYFSAT